MRQLLWLPGHTPVLNRFGQVADLDGFRSVQIGNGTSQF